MPVFGNLPQIIPPRQGRAVNVIEPQLAEGTNVAPSLVRLPSQQQGEARRQDFFAPAALLPSAGIPTIGASSTTQAGVIAGVQPFTENNRPRVEPAAQVGAVQGRALSGNTNVGPSQSSSVAPSVNASSSDLRAYVQSQLANYGWDSAEFTALERLINNESSWRATADNPTSTAYGLFQFLSTTARNYGVSHPDLDGRVPTVDEQVRAGLKYISDRYGTPSRALAHWQSRVPINGRDVGNWYALPLPMPLAFASAGSTHPLLGPTGWVVGVLLGVLMAVWAVRLVALSRSELAVGAVDVVAGGEDSQVSGVDTVSDFAAVVDDWSSFTLEVGEFADEVLVCPAVSGNDPFSVPEVPVPIGAGSPSPEPAVLTRSHLGHEPVFGSHGVEGY